MQALSIAESNLSKIRTGSHVLTPIDINGLTIVALGVLLAAVVWVDMTQHRIENVSVMSILLLGLLSQLLGNGVPGIVEWLGGAAAGLVFMLPFYIGGGMAAGDVKLLAAIGSVLGPIPTVFAGGVTLVAGLALAMIVVAKHKWTERNAPQSNAVAGATITSIPVPLRKQRLPYAAAIAAGAVGGLLYSGRLQIFFGALV
jgi:prepilin peptidase CpaA